MFRAAVEDVNGKADFNQVKSCPAFGTGSDEREMEFARSLLPNLRSSTAVEPDPESVRALRTNFQKGLLPGVETSIVEKSLESSIGNYSQVDAVLLFNVLGHIHTDDRKALFQKLMSRYLSDAAMIAVCCMCSNVRSMPIGIAVLMERWSDSLSRELIVTNSRKRYWRRGSFRVVFKHDFEARRDLSNPSDDVVKIIQMRSYHKTKSARLSTTYYTVSRTWMLR